MPWQIDLRTEARKNAFPLPRDSALAESARATWHARMVNEWSSHAVFLALADQIAAAGIGEAEAKACRAFADEERRHGELCGAVVESLGGEAVAELLDPRPFPRHAAVGPREGVLRNVLSVSCMSETVAVALIGAERIEMPGGPLRTLLTHIWADEVGHARFGWVLGAKLASALDDAARTRMGAYLAVAFGHLEAHELAHLPVESTPSPDGAVLGLCNGSDARVLFYETIHDVIVPGLERLSLPAARAWASRTPNATP